MVNTYIPAMFQARGLAIHTVSNILFWAVLCEVPVVFFSYLFMDRFSNKVLLIVPTCIVLAQFLSFGLNLYLPIQIFWTFLAKHPAGMVVVMMNLKVVATLIPYQTPDDGTGFDSNRAQPGFYFCPNDFWRDFRT
ncbi:hypothetical protein V4S40_06530 [Enterococcus cecorum]